jgi:exopolysaccharide biosynthesis polyprenyl glycosylphosphotransferase
MSNRSFRHFFITLNALIDLIAVNGSILIAYWLRFRTDLFELFAAHKGEPPPIEGYIQLLPLYTLFWLVTTRFVRTYASDNWNQTNQIDAISSLPSIFKAATYATISLICALFFYRSFSYSRWVIVLSWTINMSLLWLNRTLVDSIQKLALAKGIGLNRAALLGFNTTVESLAKKLQTHKELGYDLVGIIYIEAPYQLPNQLSTALKILGPIEELRNIVEKHRINDVFIASPNVSHEQILKAVHLCEGKNVKFRVMPDLYEIMVGKVKVENLDGIPIVCLKELPLQSLTNRLIKRGMDILISSLALIILSPLILAVAISTKATSKGAVIFKQERVSRNGRRFMMYKFRSMRLDAEAGVGHRWAENEDPRRTKLGKFLRRWSLDEIPQFLNVIKGDMSLVGPRPEMSGLIDKFSAEVPHYLDRHQVKCGITGWAQVNGLRGNTSLEERIKYDLYYIENWSLWLDLKIMLKTISALRKGN